jgi:hypothetical protein
MGPLKTPEVQVSKAVKESSVLELGDVKTQFRRIVTFYKPKLSQARVRSGVLLYN